MNAEDRYYNMSELVKSLTPIIFALVGLGLGVYAIAVNSQIGGSLSLAALSGAAGLSNSSTGSNRFKQESTHFQGDFKGNLDNIPSADANQKTQNPVEGAKE